MRITSGTTPSPMPWAPLATGEQYLRNFANFLADGEPAQAGCDAPVSRTAAPLSFEQERKEVFAFQALGMFGRHGAAGAKVSLHGDGTGPPSALSPLPGANAVAPEACDAWYAEDGASSVEVLAGKGGTLPGGTSRTSWYGAHAGTAQPRDGAFTDPAVAGTCQPPESGLLAAGGQASSIIPADVAQPLEQVAPLREVAAEGGRPQSDAPEPSGKVVANRLDLPSGADAGTVLVAGEDGALSIALRSAEASVDTILLRRAISSAVTEFGMQVSELRINGESHDFITAMGGSNGGRAR